VEVAVVTQTLSTAAVDEWHVTGKLDVIPKGAAVVLFSGGWDSTYCLLKARERERSPVIALYGNYGQTFFGPEFDSAVRITAQAHTTLHLIDFWPKGGANSGGTFADRNSRFIIAAARLEARVIYFGSRNVFPAFDKHGDSNWFFARRMSKEVGIPIITPCTAIPKQMIVHRVRIALPHAPIYSTERGYEMLTL
jgi:hypothetical protein